MRVNWDRNIKYSYDDFLEWKRAGYRGMELLCGVPYQYGVCVFDEEPVRYPPETIHKILTNFYTQLTIGLKDHPYHCFRSKPILLDGTSIIPDLIVINGQKDVVVVAEMAESEKYQRHQQCEQAGCDYWVIYPDSQCISVFSAISGNGKVYGSGDRIPIAESGCTFFVDGVWEPPQ